MTQAFERLKNEQEKVEKIQRLFMDNFVFLLFRLRVQLKQPQQIGSYGFISNENYVYYIN